MKPSVRNPFKMNTEKTDRSGLIDLMALTETPSFGFGETLVRVNHVDQGVRTGLAVEVVIPGNLTLKACLGNSFEKLHFWDISSRN